MVVRRLCAVLLILMAAFIPAVSQVREKETVETREEKIRDLLEEFNQAYQRKDVEGLSQLVAPDMTGLAAGKTFSTWNDFRDKMLQTAFSRQMPPSTWEVEKIVTTPEMAWAYTKTMYKSRRKGQPVQADLYQVFVLQKLAPSAVAKSKSVTLPSSDWKIVLIDYTFHAELLNQPQPSNDSQGAQSHP